MNTSLVDIASPEQSAEKRPIEHAQSKPESRAVDPNRLTLAEPTVKDLAEVASRYATSAGATAIRLEDINAAKAAARAVGAENEPTPEALSGPELVGNAKAVSIYIGIIRPALLESGGNAGL